MNTIKLNTKIIEAAATASGITPEKFVSQSLSISHGRVVCAHFKRTEGDDSVFSLDLMCAHYQKGM